MYEGTFLVAVASAYFLALNGLAAYLFLQLAKTRQEVAGLRTGLQALEPPIRQMAGMAALVMEAGVEGLKCAPSQEGARDA